MTCLNFPMPDMPVNPGPFDLFNFDGLIEGILPIIMMFFLFMFMMILYKKARYILLITVVFIASIFAWIAGLESKVIPFNPVIPNMFIIIQLIYWLMCCYDLYEGVKGGK